MQTRWQSLLESCVSTAIGYLVALLTQFFVFPLFAIKVSLSDNLLIGGIFTAISILRSFAVRRLFNHLHRKDPLRV